MPISALIAIISADPALMLMLERLGEYAITYAVDKLAIPLAEKIAGLVVEEFFKRAASPEFIKQMNLTFSKAAQATTEDEKTDAQDDITKLVNTPT